MKNRHTILFIAIGMYLLLGMATAIFAQDADTSWTQTFGLAASDEYGDAVLETNDGGFIMAGRIGQVSGQPDSGDVYISYTNADGALLWSKRYGGDARENGALVVQTADNGYLLAATTFSFGAGNSDFWVIKTDANGDSLWSRTYGGADAETLNDVVAIDDGGFLLLGTSRTFGPAFDDAWLVRLDSEGDTLWTKAIGGGARDNLRAVCQTANGGFAMVGRSFSFGDPGQPDVWVVHTDANGDTLWTRNYNGPHYPWSSDDGNDIVHTADGGFAIIGSTNGLPNTTNSDIWLLKTDANGDTSWTATYGESLSEEMSSLVETADGGFLMAGFSSDDGSNQNAWLLRTSAFGDSLWIQKYGGDQFDRASSIAATTDNGFIVSGFTSSFGSGGYDAWLLRITGEPSVGIHNAPATLAEGIELAQNYPNPFNPSTSIQFSLRETAEIELRIYNMLGQQVRLAVSGRRPAGSHRFVWDGRDDGGQSVVSGIYFYRLATSDQVATRRMILLK